MNRSRFLRHGAALFALSTLLSLASCKPQEEPTNGSSPATAETSAPAGGSSAFDTPRKAEGTISLHMITNNSASFWEAAEKGLDAGKSEAGVEAKRLTPAAQQPTHSDQKKVFEQALAASSDGIAVTPIDPEAFAPLIDEAMEKGTPVITFDSDSDKSKRLCYLGTNNFEAGKAAGEAAKKALPEGGKFVAFVGNMSSANARERYEGFLEAVKGSKIEMLQEPFQDKADPNAAIRNANDAITKYGDKINGMLGIYAYNGPACLKALEDAKMLGKVKIITFDGAPETLAALQGKKIDAAIVQKPYEFGRLSVKLLALINKKGYKAAMEEFKPELEKLGMKVDGNIIDTGVTTVTPENIGPFMENLKKLGLETT
jgi:ribose transport system substrate-binding protein